MSGYDHDHDRALARDNLGAAGRGQDEHGLVNKAERLKFAQVHALLAIDSTLAEILAELRKREPLETYAAGYQAGLNAKPLPHHLADVPTGDHPEPYPEPRSGH
jgi:hypothetical protein